MKGLDESFVMKIWVLTLVAKAGVQEAEKGQLPQGPSLGNYPTDHIEYY